MSTQTIERAVTTETSFSHSSPLTWHFPRQGEWTFDHWLQFPDDGWKYEILDGVLHMSPPPSIKHQDVSLELAFLLRGYVRTHRLGKVLEAPCGVRLPNQSVPVEPDILFVRRERRAIIQQNYVEGPPDLVVEVLSPSNSDYDLETKKLQYEQAGVGEYWIVNPWDESVLVLQLQDGRYGQPVMLKRGDELRSAQVEGFVVTVERMFDLGD